MSETLQEKIEKLKTQFAKCADAEARYDRLMDMGRELAGVERNCQTDEHLVKGCQSVMYLQTWQEGDTVHYRAQSDALISAGIAAMLTGIYSGETVETILKHDAKFVEELGIPGSLSPSRANGLASLLLKMKQDAMKLLLPS